jgi:hypothetical protein
VTRTQRQIEEHRQGPACIDVRDAADRPCPGVAVWVEQETHAFTFGCVAPDAAPASDPSRCAARLHEVFNRLVPADAPADPDVTRVDAPDGVHVGRFRVELDRLASAGRPLDVYVRGRAVGLADDASGRAAAERVVALYSVCFAHPAVRAIHWVGFWDGEAGVAGGGLLRLDFAPKPAFRYLQKLIDVVWHTRAAGETDRDGRFQFRGFFGDYRVAVHAGAAATRVARLRLALADRLRALNVNIDC